MEPWKESSIEFGLVRGLPRTTKSEVSDISNVMLMLQVSKYAHSFPGLSIYKFSMDADKATRLE